MAPSFDHLREEDLDEEDIDMDEVDISDLREKYEVQLEQGYDTFVVIDGLPAVTEEQKPKLIKFLLKKLTTVGRTSEDAIYMPMGDDGMSLRYAAFRSRCRALRTQNRVCTNLQKVRFCRILVARRSCCGCAAARLCPSRQEAHHARQQAHGYRPVWSGRSC